MTTYVLANERINNDVYMSSALKDNTVLSCEQHNLPYRVNEVVKECIKE